MAARGRRYWLVKSEPEAFSWDDLWASPRRTTGWDGVRNYQARNTLRDEMRAGDGVLFYHSRARPPAVVGVCEVVGAARPDPTQFEAGHAHEDPGSEREDPRWWLVDLRALAPLKEPVTLDALKADPKLAGMAVVQRGQRLSVQPVTAAEWREVLRMGGLKGDSRLP